MQNAMQEAAVRPAPVEAHAEVLAREFVDLLYPAAVYEQEYVDEMRGAWLAPLESIEQPKIKAEMRRSIEREIDKVAPILRQHYPKIMSAYASTYAKEFTVDELRQIVDFAKSPAGSHFLRDRDAAEFDERVGEAGDGLLEALEPLVDEMRTALCRGATQVRVAQGDTDAKCSRA